MGKGCGMGGGGGMGKGCGMVGGGGYLTGLYRGRRRFMQPRRQSISVSLSLSFYDTSAATVRRHRSKTVAFSV